MASVDVAADDTIVAGIAVVDYIAVVVEDCIAVGIGVGFQVYAGCILYHKSASFYHKVKIISVLTYF